MRFSPIKDKEEASSDDPESIAEGSEDDALEFREDDYEKIRDEIRDEVLSEAESLGEDLDEDLKIARLKRLAKEGNVRRPGASVRRLGGD